MERREFDRRAVSCADGVTLIEALFPIVTAIAISALIVGVVLISQAK